MTKRLFDKAASSILLVIFAPLMLGLAVWIRLDSPGPIFYRGERVGMGGRRFKIFKFRSMVVEADQIGGPSSGEDDPRITAVGKTLRRYKFDELPQLINVVLGQMSLVGPRPEVPEEVEKYTEEERGLLTLRPGITDYASIKFNNEGEILAGASDPHQAYLELIRPEKVRLGLEYVRTRSLLVDIQILWKTFTVLFSSRVESSGRRS